MRWWCVVVPAAVVVGGCADPVADTRIPDDVLAQIRADMTMPELDRCPDLDATRCDALAKLGQELFADPAMSGVLKVDVPGVGKKGEVGKIACTTCHQPGYLVDTRGMNAVSASARGTTKHNAMSLTNEVVRDALAAKSGNPSFGWTGLPDGKEVFEKLALPKAMNGNARSVHTAIGHHRADYDAVFDDGARFQNVIGNAAIALDIYERRLVSLNSPFDRFLAGDETAMTPQQQHGFELFAGPATCIECHRGPMLTDLELHVTGVAANSTDGGRADDTKDPADKGKFLTASLRNVAMTGPYMHGGQFADLREVVEFYRRGGGDTGLVAKDPRIEPLVELTDEDADDLVEFLKALTGDPIGTDLVGEPN